jgi:hypothetical protein
VVAECNLLQNGTYEPAVASVEYRHTMSVVPAHLRELIGRIARLSAEDLSELPILFLDDVHCEQGGLPRERKGVVLVGDTSEEAGRVNAALRREADEAARELALHGCRHDVHGIVERCGQTFEP